MPSMNQQGVIFSSVFSLCQYCGVVISSFKGDYGVEVYRFRSGNVIKHGHSRE